MAEKRLDRVIFEVLGRQGETEFMFGKGFIQKTRLCMQKYSYSRLATTRQESNKQAENKSYSHCTDLKLT